MKSLKQLLLDSFGGETASEADKAHVLRVTTAALMIEVARADFREDVAENERIFELLKQHFSLLPAEVELIMEQAAAEVDDDRLGFVDDIVAGEVQPLREDLAETEKPAAGANSAW